MGNQTYSSTIDSEPSKYEKKKTLQNFNISTKSLSKIILFRGPLRHKPR